MRKLLIFFFFIIPFIFAFDAYPGYDTLKWCRFEPHSSGYTGSGKYFGYGIKLTPQYCLSSGFSSAGDLQIWVKE
jgi:hypothetical protein